MSKTINLDLPEKYWEDLRVVGVGRDGENDKALVVYLSRGFSDREITSIHDHLRTALPTAIRSSLSPSVAKESGEP